MEVRQGRRHGSKSDNVRMASGMGVGGVGVEVSRVTIKRASSMEGTSIKMYVRVSNANRPQTNTWQMECGSV